MTDDVKQIVEDWLQIRDEIRGITREHCQIAASLVQAVAVTRLAKSVEKFTSLGDIFEVTTPQGLAKVAIKGASSLKDLLMKDKKV